MAQSQEHKNKTFANKGEAFKTAKQDAKVIEPPLLIVDASIRDANLKDQTQLVLIGGNLKEKEGEKKDFKFGPDGLKIFYNDVNVDYYYKTSLRYQAYQAQGINVEGPKLLDEIVIQHHPKGHTFYDGKKPIPSKPHYHVRPLNAPLNLETLDGLYIEDNEQLIDHHITCKFEENKPKCFINSVEQKCFQHYHYEDKD